MSRGSPGGRERGSRTVAAMREAGGQWCVVIAQGPPVRVLEARSLAAGEVKPLEELLRRFRAERLVRLVPGSRTIARCVNIPPAPPAEALSALQLIAEAELPETLPAHRRAAGLIPDVAREGVRTGLLTGWPERDGGAVAPLTGLIPESWAAEAAALAFLRGPGSAAVFADRQDGSVAVIASGETRTVARVLLEDNSSADAWTEGAARAIRETHRLAGTAPSGEPADPQRALLIEEESLASLAGPSLGRARDQSWLSDFGLPLGGALIALAESPAVRSLAGMSAEARGERRSAVQRSIEWLSDRRRALATAAAGAVALLVLPLGIAWARTAVLEGKVSAMHARSAARDELERSAALYAQLRKSRWPMTKLLADVSGALPVGVRVDSVRLSPDQGLGISARADSSDAVSAFQQALNKTGIFRDVQIARSDSTGGGVEFEVNATVASPFLNAPPAEDFAATPLAVRLYGEGASNTNWSAGEDSTPGVRGSSGRAERFSAPASRGESEDADKPSIPERPSGSTVGDIPPPLTDDQIKAMEFGPTNIAWAKRKGILGANKSLTPEDKERLTAEMEKLAAHRDELKAGMSK